MEEEKSKSIIIGGVVGGILGAFCCLMYVIAGALAYYLYKIDSLEESAELGVMSRALAGFISYI